MAVLLAPTVPSEPNPQNLQAVIPSGVTSIFCTSSKDVYVTSSSIPMVNLFFGLSLQRFSYTAAICDGYGSLEPNPNLPPTTTGASSISLTALSTSKYKGSPEAPGSFVLSSTAIFLTVLGISANNLS